jgi:hypothetical protein
MLTLAPSQALGQQVAITCIADADGSCERLTRINSGVSTVAIPFLYEVTLGNVPGKTAWNLNGHNDDVPATFETLRHESSNMPYLTGNDTFTVVSTSVEDDPDKGGSVAGTGCHSIVLSGLDASGDPQSEEIATNGTAEVTSSGTYHRVFKFYCEDVGTGEINAGDIEVEDTGNSGTFLTAIAGEGDSHDAVWTVPAGKTAYLTDLRASEVKGKETEISIFFRPAGKSWRSVSPRYTKDDLFQANPGILPVFAAGTDVEVRGAASGGAGKASCGMSGWYQ